MDNLDHYFREISDLAERLDEGMHFDIHLQTFQALCSELRSYLYRYTDDPVIHGHLDRIGAIDRNPVRKRLIDHLVPSSGQAMYGRYQQREKIREQARKQAARFQLIRRLLGR